MTMFRASARRPERVGEIPSVSLTTLSPAAKNEFCLRLGGYNRLAASRMIKSDDNWGGDENLATKIGIHENLGRTHEVKSGSDRSFGLLFAAIFLAISLWPLLDAASPRWWALAVAALFLCLAVVRPASLAPLNRLWFRLGLLLHRIANPVVMGVLLYLVFTPVGLVCRARGMDLLNRKLDPGAAKAGSMGAKPSAGTLSRPTGRVEITGYVLGFQVATAPHDPLETNFSQIIC